MAISLKEILNLMGSFRNPVSNTGRSVNMYPDLKLRTLSYTGWAGTKQIMFKGEVQSSSSPGNRVVNLMFYGLDISNKATSTTPFRVKIDNKFVYFSLPSMDTKCALRCTCFTPDTLIRLYDGSMVAIESLVGQSDVPITAYDTNLKSDVLGYARNIRKTGFKEIIGLVFDNGNLIKCTKDHEFLLTSGEYKKAEDLTKSDIIESLSPNGTNIGVSILRKFSIGYSDVYCMTVDNYSNYYVNNGFYSMCVHNCPDAYYRWGYYLHRAGSWIGPAPSYKSKGVRPPVNPNEVPGICKHMYTLVRSLASGGVLK